MGRRRYQRGLLRGHCYCCGVGQGHHVPSDIWPNVALTAGPAGPGLLSKDDSGEALFEVSDQSPRRLGGKRLGAVSDGAQSPPEASASLLLAGTVSLEDSFSRIEHGNHQVWSTRKAAP